MNEKQMRVECAHGYGNAQGPRRTRGAVGAAHGATQGCESSLLSTLEPIAGGEPLRRVRGRAVPAVLCQEARPAEPRAGGVFPAAADRVFRGDRFGALDKGYHSNEVLTKLAEWEVRSYCSEPERGRRRWEGKKEEQAAVYANRRRIRGERGKRLLRQRGEKLERSFAHLYETGGMRRVHLRRHPNILKRLLVHVAAFNLGLVMRQLLGRGTPRGLQGCPLNLLLSLLRLLTDVWTRRLGSEGYGDRFEPNFGLSEPSKYTLLAIAKDAPSTTGCYGRSRGVGNHAHPLGFLRCIARK